MAGILLTNLNDHEVLESINLLGKRQRELVAKFIENKKFLLPISNELIEAINTVLKVIHQEIISLEDIIAAFGDENPIRVKEIQNNNDKLLHELVEKKDENRLRIRLKK